MTRRLTNWLLKNVLLGAIPLIAELVIRWAANQHAFGSEKNIPELMFLVAMANLGTADDVERAGEVLDETKPADKALKESLTNWHNWLMTGMVIASVFFGGYLVVDTLGTSNKEFLPHILWVAWGMTGLFLASALTAEVFVNKIVHTTARGGGSA